MIRPNENFRPDPYRAVFLTGEIRQETLDQLSPKILKLMHSSSGPISLYIESPGGSPWISDALRATISAPDHDSGQRHRLITVGLNTCASAACDLLISGDYAVVYPHTTLLCHGVRQSGNFLAVTKEEAAAMAQGMAASNEQFALQIASNAIHRFLFRFVTLRPSFAEKREQMNDTVSTDATLFINILCNEVSPTTASILRKATISHFDTQIAEVLAQQALAENAKESPKVVEIERVVLNCLIGRLIDDHSSDESWDFRSAGLAQLQDQFEIFVSGLDGVHTQRVETLIERWGPNLLSRSDAEQLDAVPSSERQAWIAERVGPIVKHLWFIFLSICRRLQKSENYLSATDAYWIGLIDEVIGRYDLPSVRLLVEFAPDSTAS